jgi:transposase InsO family protein
VDCASAAMHATASSSRIEEQNQTKQSALGDGHEHVPWGRDGWAHLVAVIDCRDRELIGYEFALRGRSREAERAIEEACIRRFGTLRPSGRTPVIRSDDGLIFQSQRFRAACRDYRLSQEFITPYTPEQNGLIGTLLSKNTASIASLMPRGPSRSGSSGTTPGGLISL